MIKQIFVNLPVRDLKQTIGFFTKLGFRFNPKFTDKKATCMIISENIFVMLLTEKFFKSFIKKEICDTQKNTEVLLALSAENKNKVDEMIAKALNAGAKEANNLQDYGWMYSRSFEDLDGHIWEIFYMDEEAKK
ncbi:extradiol dioxygenase [Candidatus Peregrinibacteria bacterium RIFOXYA12_FULL_33_12]|nr:MAG: extradiol dioxygenase [Candidatus Peregrinibacteria bacterium RIFOXYA12_FULL_33_12]